MECPRAGQTVAQGHGKAWTEGDRPAAGLIPWRSSLILPRPIESAVGDDEPQRPADVIDLDELWLDANHMNDTVDLKDSWPEG